MDTVSRIKELLLQNDVQINDVQMERLHGIWMECNHDLNRFITALFEAYFTTENEETTPILPHRVTEVILHKFIKNTDLNTANVVHIASIFIPKLDPDGKVNIDEFTDVLVKKAVSGRVFAKGTDEFMHSGKFSRLFKSMSSWKDNKSVFSRFWKKMNKWEVVEVTESQKPFSNKSKKTKSDDQKQHVEDTESVQEHANGDECKYDISECPQCQNIKSVLIKYQSTMTSSAIEIKSQPVSHVAAISQSETALSSMYEHDPLANSNIFDDDYSVSNLLDDFHHLIHDHCVGNDPSQFKEASEFMRQFVSCDLSECAFARRHYGRRRGDQRNSDLLHDDDCRIDILQQIHCYILHSIEFSNISQSERMEMETENREMKESNDGGTTQTQPNVAFIGGPSTKFVSSTGSGRAGDVEYTEGIRYWYWAQGQKPEDAVLVTGKYNDLKQEMLSGGRIGNEAWDRLEKLCETLLGSNWVKKITANGNGYDIYGIKSGVPLDIGHLIALKLYTDFDDLNHLFCDQFRIGDQTDDHSEWWNMGKLLTECVQCFGKLLISKKVKYYRGLKMDTLARSFRKACRNGMHVFASQPVSACVATILFLRRKRLFVAPQTLTFCRLCVAATIHSLRRKIDAVASQLSNTKMND